MGRVWHVVDLAGRGSGVRQNPVMGYTIAAMGAGDHDRVLAAGALFDNPPNRDLVSDFLRRPGHHLLLAFDPGGVPIGFVTGVEVAHPDKATELLVYEIAVAESDRRRGVATALLGALTEVARAAATRGVWVVTEPDNDAACATYRSIGARPVPAVTFDWDVAWRPSSGAEGDPHR